MIIYGAILSPFVRKVLMFAAEKGVTVELRPGGMGRGGAEFAAASPFAKMPALRDTGVGVDGSDYCLSDSSAICVYMDAKYPASALIPAEPQARGRVIWFDEFADTILGVAVGKMFFNRIVLPRFSQRDGDLVAADAAEQTELPPILDWLNGELAGREWLVGDTITLADIAVAQQFGNLAGAGYRLDPVTHPDLVRWLDAMQARPSLSRMTATMAKILATPTG